jgi:hypothetical protein
VGSALDTEEIREVFRSISQNTDSTYLWVTSKVLGTTECTYSKAPNFLTSIIAMGKTRAGPRKGKSAAGSAALPTVELAPSNRPEYRAVCDAFMKGHLPNDLMLREYHESKSLMNRSILKGLARCTRKERFHWNKIANECYRLHCFVDPDTAEIVTTEKFKQAEDSSDDELDDSLEYENGQDASPTDALHSETPARE